MPKATTCIACCDDETGVDLIQTPCGKHAYCIGCLRKAVRLVIDDERDWPIHCGAKECDLLNYKFVSDVLSQGSNEDKDLLSRMAVESVEHEVFPKKRIYCTNPRCITANGRSHFIDAEQYADGPNKVTCPYCIASICIYCRGLIDSSRKHSCNNEPLDAKVQRHLSTIPESERWLWQKCWACASWVIKAGDCNHMTCTCSAEFCLICGRQWKVTYTHTCAHGCPFFEKPDYDEEGYNQNGFHRETGLDRHGRSITVAIEQEPRDRSTWNTH